MGAPVILAGGQAFTLASAGSAAGCDVGTMMVGGGPYNAPMLMVPPSPGAAASLGLIDPLDYPLLKNAFGPSQVPITFYFKYTYNSNIKMYNRVN